MKKQFGCIYPSHLEHEYSDFAGIKTKQFPIGLYDCNETKTQDVIKLLKMLTEKYVPVEKDDVIDEVFFGGDRLTDERIQAAQQAMGNSDSSKQKLQGFISKIEDWHRMMNFMEAICKLTYNSQSNKDRGTACYFRNFLNARNVKGKVKNSFRAYKHLYYTIFDAICCILFLKEFKLDNIEDEIELPENFSDKTNEEKIEWLNSICLEVVQKWFFENDDMFQQLREVLENPDHPENYWVANEQDGRFSCHFCDKFYLNVGSLKTHEVSKHQYVIQKAEKTKKTTTSSDDELFNYILLLFKLTGLLRNLDTVIDMADGRRSVRSCKYELPVFNKTEKMKYVIGCIHLTALSEEILSEEQQERLVANRTINLQGGKNNNIALDEYLEMLNRDSKDIVTGHQTKESIIAHSKQYPHLINYIKHFDVMSDVRQRKGFHKLPSYKADVMKVAKELLDVKALDYTKKRTLICKELCTDRNPFENSYKGLATFIHRHKPMIPFSRLRNKRY